MYAYELKHILARLKKAEKKGLPAHDSACINGWIAKAKFHREIAKDRKIGAALRKNAYARAINYLLPALDLLRSFETSIAKPDTSLEDWLKELQ